MSHKLELSRYTGETTYFWQYEKRSKENPDLVYPYCYPKYKIIQNTVTGRNGNTKIVEERVQNPMPDRLKELKKKTFNPTLI